MPDLAHPEEGMVYACPECDAAPVYERSAGEDNIFYDPDCDYVCYDCHTGIQAPIERRSRAAGDSQNPTGSSQLVETLLDAEPEVTQG